MERSPTPRLIAHPGPAKRRIHKPLAVGEGGPTEACPKRPPAIAIGATGIKSAIGKEICEPRNVIRRTSVLQRRGGCGRDGIDAAQDPLIEVVLLSQPGDAQRRIVASFHRK